MALALLYPSVLSAATSQPLLEPEEIVVLSRANLSARLHPPQSDTVFKTDSLTLTLTTHRIILASQSADHGHLYLREITNAAVTESTGYFGKSAKVTFPYSFFPDPPTHPNAPSSLLQLGCDVVLKFPSTADRDYVLSSLKTALSRAAWSTPSSATPTTAPVGFSSSSAGIGGIIKRKKEEKIREAKLTDTAFSGDLESLMASAGAVVKTIEKYVAKMERAKSDSSGTDPEDAKMNELLQNMGMVAGVTKESAGTLFHDMLARELATFLPPLLQRHGGMITLPEVFCIYNRARGADLVSPEDLLLAAQKLKAIDGAKLSLVTFPTGVIVIQTEAFSADNVTKTLQTLCRDLSRTLKRGATVFDACKVLNATPVLAMEMCKQAEAAGGICRDEDVEGVLFFDNRFDEFYANHEFYANSVK